MSPEIPINQVEIEKKDFETKLLLLSEKKTVLKPEDITTGARKLIADTLTKAGANLVGITNETKESLLNPPSNQFRNIEEGRGIAIKAIFGNSAQTILDDIPNIFHKKLTISKNPGTQGRGIRHLLFVLTTLAIDEEGVKTEAMIKELNTRVYSYKFNELPPEKRLELEPYVFPDLAIDKKYARIQKNTIKTFWDYLNDHKASQHSTNLQSS